MKITPQSKQKFLLIGACALLLSLPAQAGLIAHYSFDSDFTDSSGNTNHGALTDVGTTGNTAITSSTSAFGGGSIDFSDDRDFLTITNGSFDAIFADGESYTVAFWANRDSASRSFDIVAGDTGDADNFLTFVDGDTIRYEGAVISSGSRLDMLHGVDSATWNHYAYVSDGANIAIYVNGSIIGSAARDTSLSIANIGHGYSGGFDADFRGQVDEFYIFDEALTLAQIQALEDTNTPPVTDPPEPPAPVPSGASLLAHYPFDANIQDASGNFNHGNLVDVATTGNTVITSDAMFGGGAMDFSDDRDYVSIPTKVFADAATYTIAFWAKRDNAARGFDIAAGDVNDEDNFLTFYNGDILRFEGEAGGGSRVDLTHNVTTTGWIHYAYVADGTQINLYADGLLIGHQDVDTSLHLNAIGAGYIASLESDFQGKIDEFYLFDGPLTLTEVNALKDTNTAPAAPTASASLVDFGKVAFLGDSITQAFIGRQGYRYTLWKNLVQGGHSFDLVGSHSHNFNSSDTNDTSSISNYPTIAGTTFDSDNEGHWGWSATSILGATTPTRTPGTGLGKLDDWLAGYTPDTVFILLGVNDIRNSNGASAAATATNMETIIAAIKADNPSVNIFLGSVLPATSSFVSAQQVTDLNAAYLNIASNDAAVTYVDVGSGINVADHLYDGVHPNPIGEKIVGNAFYRAATATPIRVFLLGGQSNMQGVGRKSKLTALGLDSIPEVLLYHSSGTSSTGGANQVIPLAANGFDGISFGPEIGIGDALRDLCLGDEIALIKHAVGGTSLQVKWHPGADNSDTANFGAEYTTFVSTVHSGLAALRAAGYEPKIEGMFWQQGEQDAKEGLNTGGDGDSTSADNYGANLKQFVTRVREQFAAETAAPDLRFVLGQVAPYYPIGGTLETACPGRDKVRLAQLNADENFAVLLSISNASLCPPMTPSSWSTSRKSMATETQTRRTSLEKLSYC